jgi:threonyl-tRNA synthetase
MKLDPQSDLYKMRHSAAHVMATAVCRLFEDVQLDIGPPTNEGFYYDFDLPHRLGPEDFERIETEMQKVIEEDQPFECMEVSREEAVDLIRGMGQRFKIERLADIPEGEAITFYRNGEFLDLCRGPHVESTGKIKAFKLLSVAGSYYRGKETNPMLQRLYATAQVNEKQLKVYLKQLEEAKKRDHRKLGRELDLWSIQEDVGPGLVHWHPRGGRVRNIFEDFARQEHYRAGYEFVVTPHIGKSRLWETSGHLDFYKESMYASMDIDGQEYYVKPMNCPFHIQIYKSDIRSYRDLPIRYAEFGTVYRYEKAGVLHGTLRARGFTQDDAHIFCTPEQVEQEIERVLKFCAHIWHTFGFAEISAYLSTKPDKAVGEPERWDQATSSLEKALQAAGIPYDVDPGGGAFYGPKIDLKIHDAIGREWQMSTIQFDFNLPERFDLSYVGEDGKTHQPYMVHRALFGSEERFFGILIEQFGGAFPLWLAPEQVRLLPLTEKQLDYAEEVAENLRQSDFRVGIDYRSEKVGNKIRKAQLEKIPYMLILGPQEVDNQVVAVRSRTEGDLGPQDVSSLIARLQGEVESKGLSPS